MKLGVSLYSFHGYTDPGSLGIKGCIAKAKELGFEGLDFIQTPAPDQSLESFLTESRKIGEYCKEIGMEAVCYCTSTDFINRDYNEEVAKAKMYVDIAAALGCKLMRHDATGGYPSNVKFGRGFDDVLPVLKKAYTEVTEYAASKGVMTCVENHGFFTQDPDRIEKLINAVGHPNFGALVDIGNFSCVDADNAVAVGITAPYAVHAHAKDFHIKKGTQDHPGEGFFQTRGANYLRGAIVGHGDVPVRQCINALKRAGYDGFLTLEFEGMEDPIRGVSVGLNNLKRFIG